MVKEAKAKKPKGWYSASAKAERARVRAQRRYEREHQKRLDTGRRDSRKAEKTYAAEQRRAHTREAARELQQSFIDYYEGADTERARYVASQLERISQTKQRQWSYFRKPGPKKDAPPIPRFEKESVRALESVGWRHCLYKDAWGRLRLAVGFDGQILAVDLCARTVMGERAAQVRDIGRDTVASMEARGKIEYPHLLGAEQYRLAVELMSKVGIKSIDFGERVDSSRVASGVPESAVNRAYSLRRLHARMTDLQRILLLLVVVQGHTLETASRLGYGSVKVLSDELKAALSHAALHYGFKLDARRPRLVPHP